MRVPGAKHHLAALRFAAFGDDVLTRLRGAIEIDVVAFARGVFDHHNGIGSGRHAGSRHDLNASPAAERSCGVVASFDFAGHTKRGACVRIECAHGVTIACRTIERWIFALGFDFLSEHVAYGVPDVNWRSRAGPFFFETSSITDWRA